MQLKANDYPSWQNAYDILRKKTDRTIEVSFGAADDDSSEVTTLRYFFPLAESLKREKIISNQNPLILRIKVSTDSSSGDKARIERFLSQVHMDQTVRIFLNGSPLSIKEQTISRIFPLCCVQYPNLLAPYGSPPYETYTVLDKCMFSPSAKQNEGDSIYAQIANNLLGYVCNPEHFVGLQENSLIIEAAEKERLSSELYTELERQLPHMTILQQIIWLYIIRELQKLKQLFVFPRIKKAGKVELAWDVLEKGRLDSLSYGEGMYQLVENACLHSFGKCAWFGFRMYYTRRKPPMSDLIKDATTRQLLYNRYKSCVNPSSSEKNTSAVPNIFNRDCDFYFEFYVLDDASNQVGMVGNYNLKALFKRVPNIESAYLEALPEEMRGSYTRPKCEGELIPNLSHWEAANKKIPYSENLRSEIKTIDELFSLPTRKEPLQAHLDDITVHYGLRVLRRILAVNEGYLCVNSPGKMRTTDIYRNGNPSEVSDDLTRKVSHVTEWYGIIPISYQWTQAPAERVVDGQNCFGKTVDSPRKTLYCLRQEQIFSQIKGHKLKDIKTICNNLSPCLSRLSKENLNDSVSLFQVDAYNPYALEVFAKALFSEISKIYLRESSLTEVRIAVLLPHSAAILEFIHLFSAFYDHGEQSDMESTQIALCLRIDSYYDVITTLAGATLRDAYSNARLFAYHHSEEAAYYLPLLDYLTSNNKDSPQTSAGESTALFPFELCLPPKIPLGGQWTLNWQDNWFLQRMQHLLNTNIRSGSYGCLLDDVHIRLSSRIHITKFYEAELLFQNAGNVARFSYMLAQDLMYGKDNLAEGKRVLLLGYEKYSTSLMLQVEYWLKHSAKFEEVFTAIVYDGKDEKPVELRPFFSCDSLSVEDGKSVQPVAILPVGTTLSTVYKLHNAARRELSSLFAGLEQVAFSNNYCLILVNKRLSETGSNKVTSRYWKGIVPESRSVTVYRERYGGTDAQVKYLIGADAEWLDPQNCGICKKRGKDIRPIIDGKQSDTVPNSIFSLWAPHEGSFRKLIGEEKESEQDERRQRFAALFDSLIYSHIYVGNNHFQYHFDFQKIYIESQQDINEKLVKFRKDKIVHDGFHVVVSPLQITNAAFVKAVVDYAFSGNARFLHIDFTDAYREEVRTKFNYLCKEFWQLRRANPGSKFCLHFADNSIVTGAHLNRARLLLQMLLTQSRVDYEDVRLFDRIFLLVNRSSFDSVNYFAKNPRESLFAYIQLAVPSYNTENDFCPACKLVAKYDLLRKRSSTERLSGEFGRLKSKHWKRTPEEYEIWLQHSIMDNPSYLGWFKQWLYVNLPDSQLRILSFVPFATAKRLERLDPKKTYSVYNVAKNAKQQFLSETNPISKYTNLGQFIQNVEETQGKILPSFKSEMIALVKNHMIAERNYMRLYATQLSYEELDSMDPGPQDLRDGKYRDVMIDLIGGFLVLSKNDCKRELGEQLRGLKDTEAERFRLVYSTEWLISFIKVLSRPQIVNFYDYRQAITGIMSDMLRMLLDRKFYDSQVKEHGRKSGSSSKLTNWGKIITLLGKLRNYGGKESDPCLCAQFCYHVSFILIQRLADLRIHSCADTDNAISMIRLYDELRKPFSDETDVAGNRVFLEIPDPDKLIIRYLKAAKSATMTNHDDTPCLTMAESTPSMESILEKGVSGLSDAGTACLLIIVRYLFMENTRMLYSAMKELEKQIPAEALDAVDQYRPADHFPEYIELLNAEVDSCLRQCYSNLDGEAKEENILYQNVLGNFCRFWHKSTGNSPIMSKENGINPLTYMLQFFRCIDKLSSGTVAAPGREDELPYFYEELCRTICGFTGYEMCYIVYYSEGNYPEIFTQSGYHYGFMQRGLLLTAAQAEELICSSLPRRESAKKQVNFEGKGSQTILIPGITEVTFSDSKCHYLILSIPLDEKASDFNYEALQSCNRDSSGSVHQNEVNTRGFYLILQGDKSPENDKTQLKLRTLQKARDVLFMRQKLQEILSRDYTTLINFRFDCSYVRMRREGDPASPAVMHISDLHIHQDMAKYYDEITKTIQNSLCQPKSTKKHEIDLLVVSGDIVDGRAANAPEMEANYRHAEQLLNHIVGILWTDRAGYLPHDWRRRIIITTGNHDYAAMNQYRATQKRRSLTSAMPTEGESGTMSKFAYYIEFLIRYLDPPIDELLRNDLNEIRFYRGLNLKVLALNCSSRAVPRRTNKLGINKGIVMELLERDIWKRNDTQTFYEVRPDSGKKEAVERKPFRLVVGHYAPEYEISYFIDNYNVLPGWVWGVPKSSSGDHAINELVAYFERAVQAVFQLQELKNYNAAEAEAEQERRTTAIQTFKTEFECLKEAMDVLQGYTRASDPRVEAYFNVLSSLVDTVPVIATAAKKVIQSFEEKDLYQQIQKFYNWLDSTATTIDQLDTQDESISELIHNVYESICMSEQDKNQFHTFMDDINKDTGVDLYLAGHIHAYAETIGQKGKIDTLVADKFFSGSEGNIRGYVITHLKKGCNDPKNAAKTGAREYTYARFEAKSK